MKQIYLFAVICAFGQSVMAQVSAPTGSQTNAEPNWGMSVKSATDSCGAYFNNYIGLAKTSSIRIESMRVGNAVESGQYNGRAQKFKAPQAIEVSGIEFYAYIKDNPSMDSIMVIAAINEYDAGQNTLGTELARDTVYVTHHTFNPSGTPLPNIAVQSYFDAPVTVSSEYMISIKTPTDDSLKIIANDPSAGDGNGEGMGYAQYDNPNFASFFGWYDMLSGFSADYDFLISPMVRFQTTNGFPASDTTVCPGVTNDFCIEYAQTPIFSEGQYYANGSTTFGSIHIDWDDMQSDSGIDTVCHTYNESGVYDVTFVDTFYRWDNNNDFCAISHLQSILVHDSISSAFTFNANNLTVDFTSTLNSVDSVSWDFGDASGPVDNLNPTHTYLNSGTYTVWLYSFNDCMVDSTSQTVTVTMVGLEDTKLNQFNVYPNPANEYIKFNNINGQINVSIYNIAGERIYENTQFNSAGKIETEHLPNGTYFIKVKSQSNTITKKLVVKH